MRRLTSDRGPVLALTVAFSVLCACVLVTSGYIRGTDQFWYVADVESLTHGQYVTNNIYPANLVSPGPLPRSFVHNNVTLYIAVPLARLLGGQAGWLATNLACGLARRSARPVALVDADLQFGDVAVLLGVSPERSVVDAAAALHQGEPDALRFGPYAVEALLSLGR